MTYIPDGAEYDYQPDELGLVAIGWLDPSRPITTGRPPAGFIDRLMELTRNPVNLMRGWQECEFCADGTVPVQVDDLSVGHGEIRVEGADGVRYAAPDLLMHYVTAHHYLPPQEFIDAVLR